MNEARHTSIREVPIIVYAPTSAFNILEVATQKSHSCLQPRHHIDTYVVKADLEINVCLHFGHTQRSCFHS